ncbi:Ig-like domain-containing protein [Nocardioides sp.]|uniref:Ig-like domain-containing protein n=1 Tax=Nocardioides sp. TaxID=35761 RepID=UPI002C7C07FB|nr:Ig-like domain-containing protein [Nocardioides sp.]HXH77698.1 Ig-like domain-containing protein [Nocardioides sp.]
MSTTRLSKHASAGAFVLAATLGMGTVFIVPAQAAVVAAAPTATTTTVTVASATVAYGETARATVSVDTATNGGPKPAGKVELRVGDKILVADLDNSGKVTFDLPLVGASTTPYAVTATFTPTDPLAFSPSTAAPASVTVTKDATTSTVTARHKVTQRKIVAKNVVTSKNGQVPTGKVRFVLRRNGLKIAKSVVSLNTAGVARAKFLNVRKTGTYKVIAVYRGSANFLPSKGSFKIV